MAKASPIAQVTNEEFGYLVKKSRSLREVGNRLGYAKNSGTFPVRRRIEALKLDVSHFKKKSHTTLIEYEKSVRRNRKRSNAATCRFRQSYENAAQVFFQNSEKNDRRNGLANDLTIAFVERELQKPCSYCGRDDLWNVLDRIDNTLGHLQVNVVTACRRCNSIKKDMPVTAWNYLVPGIKAAVEARAFGEWTGLKPGCKLNRG